jgi:SAM-dependent methyltransferase
MSLPLGQHQTEIERNRRAWDSKPLLREVYGSFYRRIIGLMDRSLPGRIVEIGSGIGNLKSHLPEAISTDLFSNPWLDLVCDAYELPFVTGSLSHLILFDVLHHLQRPNAFLREARRALRAEGRLILFEPYISLSSLPVYGLLHHEPVGLGRPIDLSDAAPDLRGYYAAQGNATRLFFRQGRTLLGQSSRSEPTNCGRDAQPRVHADQRVGPAWVAGSGGWPAGWRVFHREAMSSFCYLLSGGFSKPAFYPGRWLSRLQRLDAVLSRWPRLFGARCLVGLKPVAASH